MEEKHRAQQRKIVVIVGPTASGKTSLAITLAQKCDGEIVSADSRQVYRGLDIGTEKALTGERGGIVHHLIDLVKPEEAYTAAEFRNDASAAIADIGDRGKLPIVAGGTFFYIETLLGAKSPADVPADPALRAELDRLSADALYEKLETLDPVYAGKIDRRNPRRLMRAIEIAQVKGHMPPSTKEERYDVCLIGIDVPPEILRERISARLDSALERGLVEETKRLLADGVSARWLEGIGLEYRVVLAYLNGRYTCEEMQTVLKQKVWQYARRQRTWLRKMGDIRWIRYDQLEEVRALVKDFTSC